MFYFSETLRNLFIAVTILVLGTICIIRVGMIDIHTIYSTSIILIPAIVIMGYLGQRMGDIMDNPRNKADADYKIAVLNALKRMDKSITLQELNEKLTKKAKEPEPEGKKDDVDE